MFGPCRIPLVVILMAYIHMGMSFLMEETRCSVINWIRINLLDS